MKLTRRSLIKLVPIGIAVILVSWWFQGKETPTSSGPVGSVSSSQPTLETGGISDFPVAWNGGQLTHMDSKDYLLRVEGDVSNPLQLTLPDLYAMSSVTESFTIECVEGWNATIAWEGIPLSHLLTQAGAPSKFDHVTIESINGYATEINQNDVTDLGVLIALKIGSAPLKIEHGYPARLVLPTKPGYQWVKYVNRITCARI